MMYLIKIIWNFDCTHSYFQKYTVNKDGIGNELTWIHFMVENKHSTSEVLVLHLELVQIGINGFISSMGIMVYQMHGFRCQ